MRRLAVVLGIAVLVALVVYASSRPGPARAAGNSITSPDTVGDVGLDTSLVLDSLGRPVVSYLDGSNLSLKLVRCGDPNCVSGNTIVSLSGGGLNSAVALDAADHPVVSSGNGTLTVVRCGDPTCTTGNLSANPDPPVLGRHSSIALDAAGNPVVSYSGGSATSAGGLRVLHCGDASCSAGNSVAVADPAAYANAGTSIAIDSAGNPVVSYYDQFAQGIKVLHCGNDICSSANTIALLDTGNSGAFSSLALDAAGNPVVSYFSPTGLTISELRVIHCGNPACTAGNTLTVPDALGRTGAYTSLKLDTLGHPVVSYCSIVPGFACDELRVLHCGDQACGSGNTIESPDTAGHVGATTSLALDQSGNPVVSYYDETNGDLKVLHCGNPTCGSVVKPTATATPNPPPLGGVADYPNADAGGGAPLLLIGLAAAAGALAFGGVALYARRRSAR